jgi:hypothetical protein
MNDPRNNSQIVTRERLQLNLAEWRQCAEEDCAKGGSREEHDDVGLSVSQFSRQEVEPLV